MDDKQKVILDTNILMGCRDEKALLDEFCDYEVMVMLGTVRELDRLKCLEGRRGFEARNGLRILRNNPDKIKIVLTEVDKEELAESTTVDNQIIKHAGLENAIVITNDLSMSTISDSAGVVSAQYEHPQDKYRKGHHTIEVGEALSNGENIFTIMALLEDVRANEYIVVKEFGQVKNIYKKLPNNCGYETIKSNICIDSNLFGKVRAKNLDPYQICAIDALKTNQINIITGPAGSGKTYLSLAAQWAMLEEGEIDGITIFVNPVKTKNSKEVGFYKGDKNDKLLQEGIGSVLASKLGGGNIENIMNYILDGTIIILPVSDIRGYEVGENRSLYITEAQNLDVELMKLALQRAEQCRVFVEGDPSTQLDGWMYEGSNNGMKRAIEVFSGESIFGTVSLETIYRSEIAKIADRM